MKKAQPNLSSRVPFSSSNPVMNEITRITILGACVAWLLSLVSYSPNDPSWTTWSSKVQFQNWMGRTGSIVSDTSFQILGIAALMLCLLGLFSALFSSFFKSNRSKSQWIAVMGLILSLAVLAELSLPKAWVPWALSHSGGMTGHLLNQALSFLMGRLGTFLITTITLTVSLLALFQFSLIQSILNAARTLREIDWKDVMAKVIEQSAALRARIPKKPMIASNSDAVVETSNLNPSIDTTPIDTQGSTFDLSISHSPSNLDREELERMAGKARTHSPSTNHPKRAMMRSTSYTLPSLSMLSGKKDNKAKTVDKNWYIDKATILVEKLKDFGVEGEVVNISPGPVITVYEFKPASGVKIKDIANLSDDLTLALSVLSVRIVAPIPGKPVVGIEIPSPHRETVYFKDLVEETPFYNSDIRIPIVLGRLASGEPVVADLASMPHLLVAGTTGTGKSVFINSIISSLLYRFLPEQLKLILVDPKMVELSHYEGIPHLLLPVVVDSRKAAMALRWTVDEMERRYTLMHQMGVRQIDAYNAKAATHESDETHSFLPYIVVVIDEYADLMAIVAKEVELSISRLAQKARASGIHLVLATQRPSTDVVTGTIKANFPSRISFRVASAVDSKTILDRSGSERLLGQGDMLFHSAGFTSLKRMQGAYIADSETDRVVEYLKTQSAPQYDERIIEMMESDQLTDSSEGGGNHEDEDLYQAAIRIVAEKGEASISLIQRHLKIGYNRAATMMERMEKDGIVASASGNSKRRSVLISNH